MGSEVPIPSVARGLSDSQVTYRGHFRSHPSGQRSIHRSCVVSLRELKSISMFMSPI